MPLGVVLLALVLAASAPAATSWKILYTSGYGAEAAPGEVKAVAFWIPQKLVTPERQMTFSWTVIRPHPIPTLVVLEQCDQPDVCRPLIMRITGQGTGTTKTRFRLTNRSIKPINIQFSYAIWEPR
jgi:hypothetical protein